MIYISHRGFVDGPDLSIENNPEQIEYLLNKDINVEIDVHFYKDKFYLGHDEPKYEIEKKFLLNNLLWCHAKSSIALNELQKTNANYFWHQDDDYTITSKGFIWIYPGKPIIDNSICVLPENYNLDYSKCYGICTDYIKKYINLR